MPFIWTLEISTQRSTDRWLAIPTTTWEHFSPPLSIYGILSLLPHWTSQTLLNSKMSLTVFIDFIQRWAWPFLSTLYIYIVNRFNSISVFNSHSLGIQCMYFFFLIMVWNYYFISARWLPPLRINKVKVKALKGKSILLTVL